jgi:hypothetical protein
MGKDSSKLQKSKPPKTEGNKILGFFGGSSDGKHPERKPVPSAKHGQSKPEGIIEAKDVVPRNADHPDDTTKVPETPLDVSKPLPQGPPKEFVPR